MQKRGGVSQLFVQNFLSHSTKKFRCGTVRCFRKFRVSQNVMHKKGISLNSVEKFSSHNADKIRRRTLLSFERILVSKIFKQKRGEASRFCRKFFLSHRTKKTSPANHSVFHKISGREKVFMDKRGGGITIFRRKVFVSVHQNISLESTLVFQKFFFIEIFSCKGGGGGITVLAKSFVSQDRNEKLCKRTLLLCRKILVSKKVKG